MLHRVTVLAAAVLLLCFFGNDYSAHETEGLRKGLKDYFTSSRRLEDGDYYGGTASTDPDEKPMWGEQPTNWAAVASNGLPPEEGVNDDDESNPESQSDLTPKHVEVTPPQANVQKQEHNKPKQTKIAPEIKMSSTDVNIDEPVNEVSETAEGDIEDEEEEDVPEEDINNIVTSAASKPDSANSAPSKTKPTENKLINLLDDGTLLVKQMPESTACSYFTSLPNIPKRVEKSPTRIHYHFEDCTDDHLGVHLAEHFGHYLLANAAQVPYTMTCGNGDETEETVMSRLQIDNDNPGPGPIDVAGHQYSIYDVCHSCYGLSYWCDKGPELMANIFVDSMWQLANTDFGRSVEPEDAVIHLRLGDAVLSGRDDGFGLLPFRQYSRLLRQASNERGELKTISVVTHSFDPNSVREEDKMHVEKAKTVADDFLDHLRGAFPNSKVVMHNSPADTPFVAYIRLMKASKVAICGASTFCTYPVLSGNGIRFLFESDKLNPWVKRLKYVDGVRTYSTNRLTSNYAGSLTDKQLMHWMRHQDPNGSDSITGPPLFRIPKTKFA